MNKIFKVIYSKTKHMYVVASELAKSHSKSKNEGATSGKALAALVMAALASVSFMAAPMTAEAAITHTNTKGSSFIGVERPNVVGNISDNDDKYENYEGQGAQGNNAITIGLKAVAADDTITIGDRNAADSIGSVYIGRGPNVPRGTAEMNNLDTGNFVTSVGYNSDATGYGSIAIGSNAKATNSNKNSGVTVKDSNGYAVASAAIEGASVALGYSASAEDGALAMGSNATATNLGTALGYGASAANGNIAIGANSVATAAALTDKGKYTDQDAASSYVSVGSSSTLRRITNVADGAADTDVATIAQLKKVADNKVAWKLTTAGDSNNASTVSAGDTVDFSAAKDSKENGQATGKDHSNLTISKEKENGTNKVNMTVGLSDNVVLGQNASGKGGSLDVYRAVGDASSNQLGSHVRIDGSTVSVRYDNGTDSNARGAVLGIANDSYQDTNDATKTVSSPLGYVYLRDGGNYYYLHGAMHGDTNYQGRLAYDTESGSNYIANLNDGLKFTGDTENTTVETKLDPNAANNTLSIKGGVTDSGKLTSGNIGVVATANTTDEKGNVTSAGGLTIQLAKDLTGITSITSQTTGSTTGAKVTLDTKDNNIDVNQGKVTNLSDGTVDATSTDAVTGKQLYNLDNSSVKYDTNGTTVDKTKITLAGGATGTTITNVKAGTISANSTDAVNGAQLYAEQQARDKAIGDAKTKYYSVQEGPQIGSFNTNADNTGATASKIAGMAAGYETGTTGIASTVSGSYSGVIGSGLQGAAAVSLGTVNVNYNTDSNKTFSGVANSIVGQANVTTNSNAALIYGAGNSVTDSYRELDTSALSKIKTAVGNKDANALESAVQSAVPNSGAQVMVMGGGNKITSAYMTQVIGVGNTITGKDATYAEGTSTQYNYVDGSNNTLTNGKGDYIIGANNSVTGDSITTNQSNIVVGDNHTLSNKSNNVVIGSADSQKELAASDAVVIGHNADVEKDGGVAIGSESVASIDKDVPGYDPETGSASTAKTGTWKATNAAASVGKADGTITRQITGVAAGTNDTDAVNVAQIKKLASINASNIGANLKKADGTAAEAADVTKNKEAWATAIGTGTVTKDDDGSKQLVTGGTVYSAIQNTAVWKLSANGSTSTVTTIKPGSTVDFSAAVDGKDGTKDHSNVVISKDTDSSNVKIGLSNNVILGEDAENKGGSLTVNRHVSASDDQVGNQVTMNGSTIDVKYENTAKDGTTSEAHGVTLGVMRNKDTKNADHPYGYISFNSNGSRFDLHGATDTDDSKLQDRMVYEAYKDGKQEYIANLDDGLKVTGDTADTTISTKLDPTSKSNALSITGGADSTNLTKGNIGVVATAANDAAGGNLNIQLAKDLTGITSITSQTASNTAGGKIVFSDTGTTISGGDVSVGSNKITNVKSGLTATDGTYADSDKSNAANIGDVHSMITKEAGTTDSKLALKANVTADNIGKNLKGSDGNAASAADQTANEEKWGEAIGTGAVAKNDKKLVTGKTVYDALHGGLDDITIGKDGKNGKDGSIGIAGKGGKDGYTMTIIKTEQGAAGVDGKDGKDGKDGITRVVYQDKDGTNKHTVATLDDGLKFKGDDSTVITKKLDEQLDITGGADSTKLTDKNIGVNNVGGKLKVQLAKDLTGITSISNQTTTGDKTTGAKIEFGTNGTTISGGDVNVSDNKITNIKAGDVKANSKDAVNGDQLYNEQQAREAEDTAINNKIGTFDDTKTYNYIDKTASISTNLTTLDTHVKKNADDISNINTRFDTLDGNAVKYDDATKSKITLAGQDGTTIDKVKDGTISATSKEAINGSQLNTEQEARKAEDTAINNKIGSLNKDKYNYIDKTASVSDNLDKLDTQAKANADAISKETQDREKAVSDIDNKIGSLDKNGNYIQKDVAISQNLSTLDGQVKTNADAIAKNTSAISEIKTSVKDLSDNAVQYDKDTSKGKITLAGKDGTTITNLKDGSIAENSKDAVNGGQLYNEQTAREKADKEIRTDITNIKDGEGFTDKGKTVIKSLAQDAVDVVGGDNVTVTSDTQNDKKTFTVNVDGNGKVASNNKGLISGDTIYKELRPDNDGSYIKKDNTTAQNLVSLDTQVKKTADLINSNGKTIKIGGSDTATKIDVSDKDGNGRTITGVVTDESDNSSAANVGYVNDVAAANTQQIYRDMHSAYGHLNNNINKAAAGSNALAALHPLDYDPADKASYAVGYGHYRNANAAAVGAFYQPNANTMVSVGVSMGNGDPGVNAGVSFKVGKGSAYNGVSKAQMAETIAAQEKQISEIKASDVAKDQRIDSLEKENQEMKKQIQEILAKLGK